MAKIEGVSDLDTAYVHAGAAIRRSRDTIAGMRAAEPVAGGDPALEAAGDSQQAVLSLYLAAAATARYCAATGESGPLGLKRLAELVATTKAFGTP